MKNSSSFELVLCFPKSSMYIIGIDECGTENENHLVLAGVAIHAHRLQAFNETINAWKCQFIGPDRDNVPLKAFRRHRKKFVDGSKSKFPNPFSELNTQTIELAGDELRKIVLAESGLTLFGAAVNRKLLRETYRKPDDPFLLAYKFILERFDHLLRTNDAKGLVWLDQNTPDLANRITALHKDLLKHGTHFQRLTEILETCAFIPDEHNIIGYADLAAKAIFNLVEHKKPELFDNIASKFYKDKNGNIHGWGLKVFPGLIPAIGIKLEQRKALQPLQDSPQGLNGGGRI